jgi:hypothetical protein
VKSEFGLARDARDADLRSRDRLVCVQSDFRQEAESDTTLKKLHDYIRDCSAVVCVIGMRNGTCPPPAAAAPFLHMLPTEFLNSAADTEHIAADMPNTAHCSTG